MIELPNNNDLFMMPSGVSEVLKAPLSPDKHIYIGHVLSEIELAGMAELSVESRLRGDMLNLHVSGSFSGEPVPLQLHNGGMHDATHEGHIGFTEPISELDVILTGEQRLLADLHEDMVSCPATVGNFLSVLNLGVRRRIAKRNPIQD